MKQRISRPLQFTIAGILLATTLAAVCLALVRYVPCLGIAAIGLSVPALVFSLGVGRAYRIDERPLTFTDRLKLFGLSLLASILALGVGIAVFAVLVNLLLAMSQVAGFKEAELLAMILASAGGIAAFGTVLWKLIRLLRSL